jgi:GrpB-like predicted nucleotidyltransferase (UPF0157 family)
MAFPHRTRDRIVPLMAVTKVTLVPPDPVWAERFEDEARRLRALFGDVLLAIHHVGSTSVPGLWAKPIIDIMPIVRTIHGLEAWQPAAEAAGYAWRGEYGIPGRRYLRTDELHVHIYQPGHPEIARHLAFRDHLRADDGAREAYATLKRELATQLDRMAYTDAKGPFVEEALRRAMGDAYVGPTRP